MDTIQRFSDRVSFYLRFRPRYPAALVAWLQGEGGLAPGAVVADVGAGTGFLAEVFLAAGHPVHAVEPNAEMREAAEVHLSGQPGFFSLDGTAEATGLADASVQLVAAGQAFHWFDAPRARAEFQRILAPGGSVALVWNDRDLTGSEFMVAYEALVQRFGQEYEAVRYRNVDAAVFAEFYGPHGYREVTFPNGQSVEREGLRGRVRSSSYMPAPGDPAHEPMMAEVDAIFDRFQQGGQVTIPYTTRLYFGPLSE